MVICGPSVTTRRSKRRREAGSPRGIGTAFETDKEGGRQISQLLEPGKGRKLPEGRPPRDRGTGVEPQTAPRS